MKKSPTERWGIFLPFEAPLSHHYEKKGNYNFSGFLISIHRALTLHAHHSTDVVVLSSSC